MCKEDKFKLLKDYENPCGIIRKGVVKTESDWMCQFSLNVGDCSIKTDWFKKEEDKIHSKEDMIKFASFLYSKINRVIPLRDVYDKWVKGNEYRIKTQPPIGHTFHYPY